MKTQQVIQPCEVRLRHIKPGASSDPGAVRVLGTWLTPQKDGVNGPGGWTNGTLGLALGEEGTAKVTLPNSEGPDGVLHRRRLKITSERGAYHPGDEWLEIRRVTGPGQAGELLGVFTPVDATLTRTSIEVQLVDALWLLNAQRETPAGAWTGQAPRDVFEHYTQAWQPVLFDDMTEPARFSYSTGEQTTADGAWTYQRVSTTPEGAARLTPPGDSSGNEATLKSTARLTAQGDWRAEAILRVAEDPATPPTLPYLAVTLSVYDTTGGIELARLTAGQDTSNILQVTALTRLPPAATFAGRYAPAPGRPQVKAGLELRMRIERRGRWTFFHVQDQLAAVIPSAAEASDAQPQLRVTSSSLGVDVDVVNVTCRELRPFLHRSQERGDARVPGDLPTAGLIGEFFDDTDLAGLTDTSNLNVPLHLAQLDPTRQPAARQLVPAFLAIAHPPVIPAENWSARFTGAIYLDLTSSDYALRVTCDDRVRVWIADTRWGEQIIDDWTTGHSPSTVTGTWLKAGSSAAGAPAGAAGPLTGHESGWYPIVIEYGQAGGGEALTVEIEASDDVGNWTALGAGGAGEKLSPLGCHKGTARLDSHYEQLQHLRDTFGVQFTLQPMSLESGEFPGRLLPKTREGRDTAYLLDAEESAGIQTQIDARETCATLVLDAQGLADPDGAAQLTREAIDYQACQPAQHLLLRSAYDTLSDITIPEVAGQRAAAMLLLKVLPWEEVSAQPLGHRDQVDSFPLTGQAALFAWKPGDGIRLDLPHLDIRDQSCRQIMGVTWPIFPDGLGRPDVRFRQRPRGFQHLIRKLIRDQRTPQRTYQQQLTTTNGQMGGVNFTGAIDEYARVILPADLSQIARCELVVQAKSASAVGTVEVNGAATPVKVAATGRLDLTPWAVPAAGKRHMFARVTGLGAEECAYQLEMTTTI